MANNVDAAFGKVCEVFGFKTLNEHQKNALKIVIEKKKDVFANLPTGFGKSVIFQALPLLYACVEQSRDKNRRLSPHKPSEGPSQPVVVSGYKRHIPKQRNFRNG